MRSEDDRDSTPFTIASLPEYIHGPEESLKDRGKKTAIRRGNIGRIYWATRQFHSIKYTLPVSRRLIVRTTCEPSSRSIDLIKIVYLACFDPLAQFALLPTSAEIATARVVWRGRLWYRYRDGDWGTFHGLGDWKISFWQPLLPSTLTDFASIDNLRVAFWVTVLPSPLFYLVMPWLMTSNCQPSPLTANR